MREESRAKEESVTQNFPKIQYWNLFYGTYYAMKCTNIGLAVITIANHTKNVEMHKGNNRYIFLLRS